MAATPDRPPRHRSFGQYVGMRLREYREERHLTREELARELRRIGLQWTRSAIEQLESGSRADISVTELLQLAIAFQMAPDQFLDGSDQRWLQGRRDSAITIEGARQTLRGVVPPALSACEPGPQAAEDFVTYEKRGRLASRAERRAARQLGVEPVMVMDAARHRWRHGLDDERDARLEQDQHSKGWRGQVTRKLMDELRDELAKTEHFNLATRRLGPLSSRRSVPRPGSKVVPQSSVDSNGGEQ